MTEKIYFEMNDSEKVFHHIAHDLDWAAAMMAEGFLTGHEEVRMDTDDFHELYEKTENHISDALMCIRELENAVRELGEVTDDE